MVLGAGGEVCFRRGETSGACRAEPGRFDIILISQGAQTRHGLEFALALHQVAPVPPVLVAAASTIDLSISRLAEAGISEVLQWPLASTELAAALTRCLRKSGTLQS